MSLYFIIVLVSDLLREVDQPLEAPKHMQHHATVNTRKVKCFLDFRMID